MCRRAAARPGSDGPGPSEPLPRGHAGSDPARARVISIPSSSRCSTRRATVCDTVFRTANALTLPISGTGSAGMEAAFVNVVGAGRRRRGRRQRLFGERMCDVAGAMRAPRSCGSTRSGASRSTRHGCSTRTLRPKVIAVVHAETSTGVRNDVEPLGAGKGDALLLVDCVTSLGGIPRRGRRVGRRHRLQRHAEVPRRAAGSRAAHRERPRPRAVRRAPPVAGTSTSA